MVKEKNIKKISNKIRNGALKKNAFPLKSVIIGVVFGLLALTVVLAGFHIPIPGADVVTDPRELFTTIGSGLTGPVGAVIIGILAGIAEPGGISLASIFAHILGALWMGLAYKLLVHKHVRMPYLLLAWFGLVLIYYFVFVVPGFVVGIYAFYPEIYIESFGEISIFQSYIILMKGALWEAFLTAIVTTMAVFAMPKKFRIPSW